MERSGNFYKAIRLGYILISILIGCMAYNLSLIHIYLRASCFLRGGEPCQRRLSRRSPVCVAQQIWYGQSRLYAGDNRQHGGGFAHCPARAHLLQSARDRLRNQSCLLYTSAANQKEGGHRSWNCSHETTSRAGCRS